MKYVQMNSWFLTLFSFPLFLAFCLLQAPTIMITSNLNIHRLAVCLHADRKACTNKFSHVFSTSNFY